MGARQDGRLPLDAPILSCAHLIVPRNTAGESADAGPAKAVLREGSGANLTARKGPNGDSPMGTEREDAGERMRRIEVSCAVSPALSCRYAVTLMTGAHDHTAQRRAAAAQQRSLDKKISSLTGRTLSSQNGALSVLLSFFACDVSRLGVCRVCRGNGRGGGHAE